MRTERRFGRGWENCALKWAMLAGLSLHGLGAGAQGKSEERRFPLGDRGALELQVPAEWIDRVGRRGPASPPTIAFRPPRAPAFDIRVTAVWPMQEGITAPTPQELKAGAQRGADATKAQAVEKSIEVLELKGPAAHGYYFRATDRAPKAGEFKYLTQGLLGVGELRVPFTILTNEGQEAVAKAALDMLRSARHVPPQARAARPVPPKPDGESLQALLRDGKLAELDAALSAYQGAYRSGAINDEAAAEAFTALLDTNPDLRPMYDRWVAEFPRSYAARLMRGSYLAQLGYLARGSEYVQKTPKARLADMQAYFKAAMEDLEASLTLDAMPALSYGTMIEIAQGVGSREAAVKYLDAAITLDRRIYTARASYLGLLRPEWGGNLEQMETALSLWKQFMEEGQWRRLNATLEDSRWREKLAPLAQLVERKRYPQAIEGYSKVLAHAEVARAYAMRGYSYAALGTLDKALADYTRALELDPDSGCCSGTRANRGRVYLVMGQKDKALEDLLKAAANDDHWAARELAMIYAFGRHGFKRDYAAARPWCERAAKQGDGLAMYCLGGIYHAGLGVPKDLPAAAFWFSSAGLRGIGDAQADVGIMYWEGQGVPQDRERAAQWWRMAAAHGNQRAAAKLQDNGHYWSYFRYVVLRQLMGGG